MCVHCFWKMCNIWRKIISSFFCFAPRTSVLAREKKSEEVKNPVSPACPSNISAAKGVFSCLAEYVCDDEKTCLRHPTTSRIWNTKKSRNEEKSVCVGCLHGPNVYSSDSQLDRQGGRKNSVFSAIFAYLFTI